MFKQKLIKAFEFIFNPHFLLCFVLAWIITNGWSYILLGIGTYFQIGWMIAVSGAYLAFLWAPISPEKILTITIAIILLKKLYPNDEKTLMVLENLKTKIKNKIKKEK